MAAPPSSTPRTAEIYVHDHRAFITPVIPALVDELTLIQRQFVACDGRAVARLKMQSITAPVGNNAMLVLDTLVPRVQAWLAKNDWQVRVTDERRYDALLPADETYIDGAVDEVGRVRLRTIAARRTAQVEVSGRLEAERQIVELTRLFPRVFTTVIASNSSCARRLYRVLRWLHGDDVSQSGGGRGVLAHPTRITVVTYGTAPHLGTDPHHMVILANAADALGLQAIESLLRVPACRGRLYGLRHDGQRLSPSSEAKLELILGPRVAAEVDDEFVYIIELKCPTQPRTSGLTGLAWKRAALWCNGPRNHWIAQVAAAVAGGDKDDLRRLGVANIDTQMALAAAQHGVRVVVESPEHGRALQRQLGGWPLLTMTSTAQHHKIGDEKASTGKPALHVIATAMQLKQHGTGPGLVIRADGNGGASLPGFPDPDRNSPAVVIDITDDFDERVQRQTARRLDGYERRGWLQAAPAPAPLAAPAPVRLSHPSTSGIAAVRRQPTSRSIKTSAPAISPTHGTNSQRRPPRGAVEAMPSTRAQQQNADAAVAPKRITRSAAPVANDPWATGPGGLHPGRRPSGARIPSPKSEVMRKNPQRHSAEDHKPKHHDVIKSRSKHRQKGGKRHTAHAASEPLGSDARSDEYEPTRTSPTCDIGMADGSADHAVTSGE